MTFRKDPVPSAEPNSIEKPVSTRPRNHHAPEPPPNKSNPCNTGVIVEQGEVRLGDIGSKVSFHNGNGMNRLEMVAAYSPSPSSSGYSSLRGSETTSQCCNQCAQFHQSLIVSSTPSSSSLHPMPSCSLLTTSPCSYINHCTYPHIPPSVCPHCQGQSSTLIFGKRVCSQMIESRKVDVPSTIKEESENSLLSQRSRSNTSMKVCFA
jgi:hypothetical protein